MELGIKVAIQVFIMFVLIMVGFVMSKRRLLSNEAAKPLTNILLIAVTPCVIIKSYQVDFEPTKAKGLIFAVALSAVIHVIGIIISTVVFKKEPSGKYKINIFSSVYSNCGFMAIPLLSSVFGTEGVFYGSAYFAVFTILSWTHGFNLYSGGEGKISLKKIFVNPGMIGVGIGFILFFCNYKLPDTIYQCIDYMAAINTPLAMIVLGIFLEDVNFIKAIKNKSLYIISFIRLILLPVITIFLMKFLNVPDVIASALLLVASTPSANMAAMLTAQFNLDGSYAGEIISLNTLFSIITIPLIMALSSVII